jgi:arsenate reductase (glutaredoxin)
MATGYVLWVDARCTASKRALELLRERGVEPELRRFLEDPPTVPELEDLLAKLGLAPHVIARPSEDEYQALRLSERTPRDELLSAFAAHPRILDGPFLVTPRRAYLVRQPERVLEILSEPDGGGAPPDPSS